MNPHTSLQHKIYTLQQLAVQVKQWRQQGKTIAFTNGCFDILHAGHIQSLSAAAAEADVLLVALNTDSSVAALKGPGRPLNPQDARATVMAALEVVDAVTLFPEPTPLHLILSVMPDVLVKGGDYNVDQIAGAKEVIAAGGRVVINKTKEGFSTTALIQKIENGR